MRFLVLVLLGCGPSAKCLDQCQGFGLARSSAQCHELCTESCETLARTYGVAEQRCEEMQAGR